MEENIRKHLKIGSFLLFILIFITNSNFILCHQNEYLEKSPQLHYHLSHSHQHQHSIRDPRRSQYEKSQSIQRPIGVIMTFPSFFQPQSQYHDSQQNLPQRMRNNIFGHNQHHQEVTHTRVESAQSRHSNSQFRPSPPDPFRTIFNSEEEYYIKPIKNQNEESSDLFKPILQNNYDIKNQKEKELPKPIQSNNKETESRELFLNRLYETYLRKIAQNNNNFVPNVEIIPKSDPRPSLPLLSSPIKINNNNNNEIDLNIQPRIINRKKEEIQKNNFEFGSQFLLPIQREFLPRPSPFISLTTPNNIIIQQNYQQDQPNDEKYNLESQVEKDDELLLHQNKDEGQQYDEHTINPPNTQEQTIEIQNESFQNIRNDETEFKVNATTTFPSIQKERILSKYTTQSVNDDNTIKPRIRTTLQPYTLPPYLNRRRAPQYLRTFSTTSSTTTTSTTSTPSTAPSESAYEYYDEDEETTTTQEPKLLTGPNIIQRNLNSIQNPVVEYPQPRSATRGQSIQYFKDHIQKSSNYDPLAQQQQVEIDKPRSVTRPQLFQYSKDHIHKSLTYEPPTQFKKVDVEVDKGIIQRDPKNIFIETENEKPEVKHLKSRIRFIQPKSKEKEIEFNRQRVDKHPTTNPPQRKVNHKNNFGKPLYSHVKIFGQNGGLYRSYNIYPQFHNYGFIIDELTTPHPSTINTQPTTNSPKEFKSRRGRLLQTKIRDTQVTRKHTHETRIRKQHTPQVNIKISSSTLTSNSSQIPNPRKQKPIRKVIVRPQTPLSNVTLTSDRVSSSEKSKTVVRKTKTRTRSRLLQSSEEIKPTSFPLKFSSRYTINNTQIPTPPIPTTSIQLSYNTHPPLKPQRVFASKPRIINTSTTLNSLLIQDELPESVLLSPNDVIQNRKPRRRIPPGSPSEKLKRHKTN